MNGKAKRALWRPACRRGDVNREPIYVVDRALVPVAGEYVFDSQLAKGIEFARAPWIVQDPIGLAVGRGLRRRAIWWHVLKRDHRSVKMQSVQPCQHLLRCRFVLFWN